MEEIAVLFKMCCSILFTHGKYNSFLLVPLNIFKIKMNLERFCFLLVVLILNVIKGKLKTNREFQTSS